VRERSSQAGRQAGRQAGSWAGGPERQGLGKRALSGQCRPPGTPEQCSWTTCSSLACSSHSRGHARAPAQQATASYDAALEQWWGALTPLTLSRYSPATSRSSCATRAWAAVACAHKGRSAHVRGGAHMHAYVFVHLCVWTLFVHLCACVFVCMCACTQLPILLLGSWCKWLLALGWGCAPRHRYG